MSQFHTGEASNDHGLPRNVERRPLPLYKLILHSEAVQELMHVVRTVMELTRFCRAEAEHKMWEAHHRGQSVLLTTWLERAELYAEQFAAKEIPVTIEQA